MYGQKPGARSRVQYGTPDQIDVLVTGPKVAKDTLDAFTKHGVKKILQAS